MAKYNYDAWGYCFVTGPNGESLTSSHIGRVNPFRYRGYYYDSETYLYYINSRYYDPYIGRWINADTTDILTATPMGLTDKNLFAYCDNNPIVRADDDGDFWHIVAGAVGGALISGGVQVVNNLLSGKNGQMGLE